MSLTDAKAALEKATLARIEKQVAARLSDKRSLSAREHETDYAIRRVMESAQERALNKLFGNYSTPNPNKNAALTALDKSIEDRIVYETTLQVLQLQDNKDLQRRIATKVNEQVDLAIARAASRVAEEYVKNLFAKYETEKLLLIASEPDKEEP
jgi:hypothetical protein